ncbi:hypothetical protein GPECTOR_465g378 [Gonium pectorale]|uniref:Uncharacterized protein n=1 Tax=Gonium pectorale TaxID=33097 RepID=A0A150FV05_GONPE|nr:hypothetical protein GPECTOR_465g378 [Gonium pectorale]|eukprot:KXZ41442.1 hypothetical protein GPECTOR_465g378 [Gonium pectorale]
MLPEDLLRFLDVLVWVEGSIYQLDEDNERLTGRGGLDQEHAAAGVARILGVLRQEGHLDERVERELQQGLLYWSWEQDICRRLLAAPRPLDVPAALTGEEVIRCHEAKSFDYRVLFLLLCRLSSTPCDETLLSFLRLDEMLVDISDDLVDYEDDVLANSFNVFRCYIHLHGRSAGLKLVGGRDPAERISDLERRHRELLSRLAPQLQEHYWRRHEEACEGQGQSVQAGGRAGGTGFGRDPKGSGVNGNRVATRGAQLQ